MDEGVFSMQVMHFLDSIKLRGKIRRGYNDTSVPLCITSPPSFLEFSVPGYVAQQDILSDEPMGEEEMAPCSLSITNVR